MQLFTEYPNYNGEKLDKLNQKKFDSLYELIGNKIESDVKDNKMQLSDSEMSVLAHNIATTLLYEGTV